MYAWIVFLLTLTQLGIVFGSQMLGAEEFYALATIYGSPLYLGKLLIQSPAALFTANVLYIGLLAYHLVKYTLFICALLRSERNVLFVFAFLLEVVYLVISAGQIS